VLAGLQNDVQTNMDVNFIQTLVPFARTLKPVFSTLPTLEQRYSSYLLPDREGIAKMLGTGNPELPLDPTQPVPETNPEDIPTQTATIIDSSGVPGMGKALAAYFKRSGLPEATVITLEVSDEPTQVLRRPWTDDASVEYYAQFLGVPIFQPYRYPLEAGPLAIQLGRDAGEKYGGLVLEAGRFQKP
jgi:hypothetical protein